MNVADAVTAHWGAPDRRARFAVDASVVEVLKYEAATTGEGVVIYATATSGPTPSGHHDEFILGLDVAHDEVADPLARLSLYARATPVHHGDTVPIDGALWPGTPFRRFLAMRQVEPVLGPVEADGRQVEFLSAVPIYESEIPLKSALGADDFILELKRQGIGFWESNRQALSSDIGRR